MRREREWLHTGRQKEDCILEEAIPYSLKQGIVVASSWIMKCDLRGISATAAEDKAREERENESKKSKEYDAAPKFQEVRPYSIP